MRHPTPTPSTPATAARTPAVLAVLAGIVASAAPALAQTITVDGQRDAAYGAPAFVQFNTTRFGDNADPDPVLAGGSEIDAVYAHVADGRLYVLVTGNLETNFNKLVLFFDAQQGGQNRILGGQPGPLGAMGTAGDAPGLTFESGFNADYFLSVTTGHFNNDTPDNTEDDYIAVFGDAAILNTDGPEFDPFTGASLAYHASDGNTAAGGLVPFDGPGFQFPEEATGFPTTQYAPRRAAQRAAAGTAPTAADAGLIQIAVNNSNTAGVIGTGVAEQADMEAAAAVTTGIEISIALDELRAQGATPVNPIRIAGWIASGDFGYLSNQVFGGTPVGYDNIGAEVQGGVRHVDFNDIPGLQYITVGQTAPEPIEICEADLDGDNRATVNDLLLYLGRFRAGCN